jgi:hypothetical protein
VKNLAMVLVGLAVIVATRVRLGGQARAVQRVAVALRRPLPVDDNRQLGGWPAGQAGWREHRHQDQRGD